MQKDLLTNQACNQMQQSDQEYTRLLLALQNLEEGSDYQKNHKPKSREKTTFKP